MESSKRAIYVVCSWTWFSKVWRFRSEHVTRR